MSDVLALAGVSVVRGDTTILDDVSWDVEEGQRWVVLGPNGAGKTTLLQLASARIHPTSGVVGILGEVLGTVDVFELRPRIGLASAALAERIPPQERVRDVVLQGGMREALTDALLFNAARRQHVQEIIRPALDSGAVVICDRYADSSMAYQGYGGGVPLDDVQTINFLATSGLSPDRTVLFDLPVEAGLQRRAVGAASDFTRFESTEQHDVAFHQRVRDGYLEMASADPARWRVIDAGQPAVAVADALWQAVHDLIEG